MITHKGTIIKIEGSHITVVISPEADDCSGCAISRMCNKSEKLDVESADAASYKVGQEVTVGTTVGAQRRATLLFFVLPVVLLLLTAVLLIAKGQTETVAALGALAVLALWYGALYLARVRFGSKARFEII